MDAVRDRAGGVARVPELRGLHEAGLRAGRLLRVRGILELGRPRGQGRADHGLAARLEAGGDAKQAGGGQAGGSGVMIEKGRLALRS